MAELEQTARYALKVAPAEALHWLLPKLDPNRSAFAGGHEKAVAAAGGCHPEAD